MNASLSQYPATTASRASRRRSRSVRAIGTVLLMVAALLVVLLASASTSHAAPSVQFGMEQNGGMDTASRDELLDRQKDLGAQVIRYIVRWDKIAKCNPAAQAALPTSTCYDFATLDAVIAGAEARGMKVILSIYGVPSWRNGGKGETWTGGSEAEFAAFAASYTDFAQAVTTRYDGKHGHPRVQQWTIWNEPNGQFWTPLRDDAKAPIGAHRYARLYDQASRRIKQVDAGLEVAPGPTAPMAARNMPPIIWSTVVMADLQALGSPVDAWAHNAYMGTMSPFNHTVKSPYVGLGNISDMARLMDQHAVLKGKPLWVTEFGYQTKPSLQPGVEPAEQARLLTDAMRFAFQHPRITNFIWYSVVDDDIRVSPTGFQSGLYFTDNTCGTLVCPKPSAATFRHPLWVSAQKNGKVTLWGRGGRTPAATRIFVKRPGEGWKAYANTNTATTGAATITLTVSNGMIAMTCDSVCGPQRTLRRDAVKAVRKVLKAAVLPKGDSLKRGMAFKIPCRDCTVKATVSVSRSGARAFTPKAKTVVVATSTARPVSGGRMVTLKFTKAGKRLVSSRRGATKLLVRTHVTARDGGIIIYDRALTLR